MTESHGKGEVWVFGDYRNYFRNRVTLQLLARARDLAQGLGTKAGVLVFGSRMDEQVGDLAVESVAHGADKVYLIDNPALANYRVETYVNLIVRLAAEYRPAILLLGATRFGRELAPRVAKRLRTGLTADCLDLRLDEKGQLIQSAPAFGGNLVADIITPEDRPQMATVRPGAFQELPHDAQRRGEVVLLDLPDDLPRERVRLISAVRQPHRVEKLETARVVVCGGRGMGSKNKFKKLHDLARLMGGEVGATRPVVYAGWAGDETLVGQAGRQVKPQVLFSFGISGAIQHTAGIQEAELIIAVNKNPEAPMMKMADVAIVADAHQVCLALIKEIKTRLKARAV